MTASFWIAWVVVSLLASGVARAEKPSEVLAKKVNLLAKDMPLRDVVKYLTDFSGVNIELGAADAEKRVTCAAKGEPFVEVLKRVLTPHGLKSVVDAADTKFTIVRAPKPAK